jgi:hypothetical protein
VKAREQLRQIFRPHQDGICLPSCDVFIRPNIPVRRGDRPHTGGAAGYDIAARIADVHTGRRRHPDRNCGMV